jgi:hypothetical protein
LNGKVYFSYFRKNLFSFFFFGDRTSATKHIGKDNKNMKEDRAGNKNAGAELEKDNWDRTTGTRNPGQDSRREKTVGIIQAGQEREDRMARI